MTLTLTYNTYWKLRLLIAILLLVYAVCAIIRFSQLEIRVISNIVEIVIWTLGPPIWFFAEYYLFDKGKIEMPENKAKDVFLDELKIYAGAASKIWAAVLAVLLFMLPKT